MLLSNFSSKYACLTFAFAVYATSINVQAQSVSTERISASAKTVELEKGFEWLADGKTLSGWEGNKQWFRVEDGAIVAGSLEKDIPNNEFLCTEKSYSDFELRYQVRLKGKGDNAGVQFRSKRVPNNHEVSGYQADVGNAWDRPVWGGLYDESRRNQMLMEGPKDKLPEWVRANDWNDLTVRAEGDRIRIWLNDHLTIDYTEADPKIPREGIIGLQIHSGPPTEAWYRAIRIQTLATK